MVIVVPWPSAFGLRLSLVATVTSAWLGFGSQTGSAACLCRLGRLTGHKHRRGVATWSSDTEWFSCFDTLHVFSTFIPLRTTLAILYGSDYIIFKYFNTILLPSNNKKWSVQGVLCLTKLLKVQVSHGFRVCICSIVSAGGVENPEVQDSK